MDIEEALTSELKSIPALGNKVYPVAAPSGTKTPYLTYSLSSAGRNQDLNGLDGLIEGKYQLDLFNSTYSDLKPIVNSIIRKIKTFNFRNLAVSGPYCQQVNIINEFETYDSNTLLYRGVIEISILYKED